MYSYSFLITIKITYKELCIQFSRPKKFYRHFKKNFSEKLKISVVIYDLYFLNNNKYQKSFEAKPLFNAVLKIYGEPCTKFSKLSYKRKKCYDFSTSKLLANFLVFDRFPTIKTTHKESCIKFSKLFGHSKIFYQHFKKNFLKKSKISQEKKFDFDVNWFCVKNPGLKSKIEAFLLLQMLSTDTKKKKTHIIVKSIHSSLRSESKNHTSLLLKDSIQASSVFLYSRSNKKKKSFKDKSIMIYPANSNKIFVENLKRQTAKQGTNIGVVHCNRGD
ncbi:hypothetical protein AGLY_011146 [Aphis glycines]|uniref:Uncharacterized protein n=1 Tax=Aphis glycines TaxID=307491 RepID=A0A6G0TDX9_APHGL|nr:hypothetical protein AGLY_011146 [Aphis glycines]